jgi:hypothetical protein
MLSPFTGQKLGMFICSENAADLLALTKLIQVRPADAGHRHDLPAERDARRHPVHARRHVRCKVVIAI